VANEDLESFSTSLAYLEGVPADWYDCTFARCVYDYYQSPIEASPKKLVDNEGGYMLVTPALTFNRSKMYYLEFISPVDIIGGRARDFEIININLDCPGYDFSCSLYDFDLDSCVSGDGKFRMELTAKGINQPAKVDLIEDFRYSIAGEKSNIMDTEELNRAPVKYKGEVNIRVKDTRILYLGAERYAIEFPYSDTAKYLSVKGRYCRNDRTRMGKSSNFEFLETVQCDKREFVTRVVDDEEPKAVATVTTSAPTTKRIIKAAEPEEEPEEITFLTFFRVVLGWFGK
jgi:hypothetical protein